MSEQEQLAFGVGAGALLGPGSPRRTDLDVPIGCVDVHEGRHPDNPAGVVAPERERHHRARIPEANPPVDLSVHLLRTRDRGVPQVPEAVSYTHLTLPTK